MTTANDIILGALLNLNVYAPTDVLQPTDSQTCLYALNDLLESLSNDHNFVFYSVENYTAWIPGQWQYTIGNPIINGASTFSGTFTQGSNQITAIPSVPSTLKVGAWITELGGAFNNATQNTSSTPITVTAIGTNTVTFAGPLGASVTAATTVTESVTYTTPGNIAYDSQTGASIGRPLKIQTGFTRVTANAASSGLDYWFDVVSIARYKQYGWKGVPGPWPYAAAYNPTFPYGTLFVYPMPIASYQVHLWTDQILTTFASTTADFQMPQGYSRALKKLLAVEIAPIYGKTPNPMLVAQAKQAMDLIKANNAQPVPTLKFDSDLVSSQQHDASWIVSGGFSP